MILEKRHLYGFFALTFAISWGVPAAGIVLARLVPGFPFSLDMYSPFYYVGVWGPALAAFIIIGRHAGADGVRTYAARLLDWRIGRNWWLFAVVGVPAMYFAGALIERALGEPGAVAWYRGSWSALVVAFLLRATAGPFEELGWRGFALPLMQRTMSPGASLVLLAVVHTVWHAPVFVVGQFAHFGTTLAFPIAFARFGINILVITLFMNIAWNATGGRVTSAFLIHWMLNGVYPWEGESDAMGGQVIAMSVVAVVMLLTVARRWLDPAHAVTTIAGERSLTVSPGAPISSGS